MVLNAGLALFLLLTFRTQTAYERCGIGGDNPCFKALLHPLQVFRLQINIVVDTKMLTVDIAIPTL